METMRERLLAAMERAHVADGTLAYEGAPFEAVLDAILTELREPDEAMVEAGYSAYCQYDSLKEDEAEMIARIFAAMIVKSPLGARGGSS